MYNISFWEFLKEFLANSGLEVLVLFILAILIIIGFWHEDKVIAFEEKCEEKFAEFIAHTLTKLKKGRSK